MVAPRETSRWTTLRRRFVIFGDPVAQTITVFIVECIRSKAGHDRDANMCEVWRRSVRWHSGRYLLPMPGGNRFGRCRLNERSADPTSPPAAARTVAANLWRL